MDNNNINMDIDSIGFDEKKDFKGNTMIIEELA